MRKTFHLFKWKGKKAILLFALTVVLSAVVIDVTIAALITRTQTIKNNFSPSEINISSWRGNDIINSGNADVYVRATVIATWVSETDEKRVLSVAPKQGTDYTLKIDSGWFKGTDGFYYFKEKVIAARSITLIEEAVQKQNVEGFVLRIQVISSAIQTNPKTAVEGSWPAVKIDEDGTLISAN